MHSSSRPKRYVCVCVCMCVYVHTFVVKFKDTSFVVRYVDTSFAAMYKDPVQCCSTHQNEKKKSVDTSFVAMYVDTSIVSCIKTLYSAAVPINKKKKCRHFICSHVSRPCICSHGYALVIISRPAHTQTIYIVNIPRRQKRAASRGMRARCSVCVCVQR